MSKTIGTRKCTRGGEEFPTRRRATETRDGVCLLCLPALDRSEARLRARIRAEVVNSITVRIGELLQSPGRKAEAAR